MVIKNRIIPGALFVGAVIIAIALSFRLLTDNLAVRVVSKRANCGISYSRLYRDDNNRLVFDGLKFSPPGEGIGFTSKKSVLAIDPLTLLISPDTIDADFSFSDVVFSSSAEIGALFPDFGEILQIPLDSGRTYSMISGALKREGGVITISGLYAASETIRFRLDGSIDGDKELDLTVKIEFSGDLLREIPEEISIILSRETEGWRSIQFSLQGNMGKPSIQLISKSFRLRFGYK
ncbi:MAG: hypothetical protein ABIJ27_04465 [Candidatus Omnitrophota bacterium]